MTKPRTTSTGTELALGLGVAVAGSALYVGLVVLLGVTGLAVAAVLWLLLLGSGIVRLTNSRGVGLLAAAALVLVVVVVLAIMSSVLPT